MRNDKKVLSSANMGYLEDEVWFGMPAWAAQYLCSIFASTFLLCWSSANVWRCEDNAEVIEKFGDHSNDFAVQKKLMLVGGGTVDAGSSDAVAPRVAPSQGSPTKHRARTPSPPNRQSSPPKARP